MVNFCPAKYRCNTEVFFRCPGALCKWMQSFLNSEGSVSHGYLPLTSQAAGVAIPDITRLTPAVIYPRLRVNTTFSVQVTVVDDVALNICI